MKNFLIIANGQFLSKEIILEVAQDKIIIALDGAAEKLRQLAIKPDIILGDFDSLTNEQMQYWDIQPITLEQQPYAGKDNVLIVPAYDQSYTDLEKAIHYCDKHNAQSIGIVCATAGRLDHHENVMQTLAKCYRQNRIILLYTEQQTLRYARDEVIIITGNPGDKCGFTAKHTGKVTSKGLVYECVDVETSFANILVGFSAILDIKGGALLFMPPLLASQRKESSL